MGILNATPDSFSDGGKFRTPSDAIAQAERMISNGADIIDIGGESTRPGAEPVSLQEELDRVLPVIEALKDCGVALSIDTYKAETMRQALKAGVDCVNDIWALRQEGAVEAVIESNKNNSDKPCGIVLMHMQRDPQTMQFDPEYQDVIGEVKAFLQERAEFLQERGITQDRIAIDPGFGFGKSLEHNLNMLTNFDQFSQLGYPVLAGISRKSMLGKLTGRDTNERVAPSIAAAILAADRGARIIRVHDVQETVDALKIWEAVQTQILTSFIIKPMKKQYFGTDGIRGEVGQFPIVPEFITRLGYAAGKVLSRNAIAGERCKVLIGKDTRISGYLLEAALEAGFAAAGVDVMLCGPMPTPGVAYLTKALRLSAGVVISASHNPYQDNGIKFFSAEGGKLTDELELAIEAELEKPMGCVSSKELGKAFRIDDAAGRYIEFCKSTFPGELNLKGMKLVVDCANGAAYHTAPPVFHELGAEVISIGVHPDGRNINDGCGATAPDALIAKVKEVGADLGIALDGDADRLQMVDASGRLFNGDELLYVLAKDRIGRGQAIGGVVGTLMTNLAVENAIKGLGIGFERANVGDRYVLELLKQKGWIIGGEGSGHLLCLDQHSTGDGTIAALQVLAAMSQSKKSLSQLLDSVKIFPQILLNIKFKAGYDWKSDSALKSKISQVEGDLKGTGRVLIRASGTEPVLRVMVEAQNSNVAKSSAKSIADLIPTI